LALTFSISDANFVFIGEFGVTVEERQLLLPMGGVDGGIEVDGNARGPPLQPALMRRMPSRRDAVTGRLKRCTSVVLFVLLLCV
jgi:hypothetical protein